jgi:hypothetical protein
MLTNCGCIACDVYVLWAYPTEDVPKTIITRILTGIEQDYHYSVCFYYLQPPRAAVAVRSPTGTAVSTAPAAAGTSM